MRISSRRAPQSTIRLVCLMVWTMMALVALYLPFSVEGQSARERRVSEARKAKETTTKPKTEGEAVPPAETKPSQPTAPPAEGDQQPTPPKPAPEKKPETQPSAQEMEADSIRINSTLVTVPVSVTDINGQPIRDLTADDFRLEEEGQPQQIQTLGDPGKTPIELALLFDVSRSVRNRFEFEKEAAGRFLQVVMKPGDNVSVFTIGRTPGLAIGRTDRAEAAIEGTRSIEPTDEATAFFDTVVKAARYIEDHAQPNARRVMVVISDGEDNNSEQYRLLDALREAQSADCLFYAINPSGPSIRLNRMSIRGHDGMTRIANDTGGMAFLPDKLEDLGQVFAHIATELQAQYLLGYYPSNDQTDGKFRRITVRIPKQPELRIRARSGYYAPKE